MRCVVLDDYQDVASAYADWGSLRGVAVETIGRHLATDDDVVAALAGAEVVVAMRERTPFTAARLARLPDLRLLVTTGMRNASIDLQACAEHGITVCGTGSSFRPPAEHTWALILGLARHLVTEATELRAGGPWQSTVGSDLRGATLGLVGLGRIGTAVAEVGTAFGMDVVAWSPHLTVERASAGGARLVGKQELFSEADFVSLHLVLSETTRAIVGAAELAAMKPAAYLVNTSRAGLVDTSALLRALDTRAIAGAGLDVFDEEPLPAGHPLRSHPRVLATPHTGYVTHGNYTTFFTEAVEDVEAWLAGAPVRVLAG